MILPFIVLVADVALWYLVNVIRTRGDDGLTLITFGLALVFLVWLIIEVYQFGEATRGRRADTDD